MPNIGANSLGFLLDLDSTKFTSAFKDARKSYTDFTRALTDANKKLNTSGQKFLDAMAASGSDFSKSVSKYTKTMEKVQAAANKKPIVQPVEFSVSQGSLANLEAAVAGAIQRAMGNIRPGTAISPMTSGGAGVSVSPTARGRGRRSVRAATTGPVPQGPSMPIIGSAGSGLRMAYTEAATQYQKMATREARRRAGYDVPLDEGRSRLSNSLAALRTVAQGASAAEQQRLFPIMAKMNAALRDIDKRIAKEMVKAQRAAASSVPAPSDPLSVETRGIRRTLATIGAVRTGFNMANSAISNFPGIHSSRSGSMEMAPYLSGGLAPGRAILTTAMRGKAATSAEARQAASALIAQGVSPEAAGRIAELNINASRMGMDISRSSDLERYLRARGMSSESAALSVANITQTGVLRGTQFATNEVSESIAQVLASGAQGFAGKSGEQKSQYVGQVSNVLSAVAKAGGTTAGLPLMAQILSSLGNPAAAAQYAQLGVTSNMSPEQALKAIQQRAPTLQRILATNPSAIQGVNGSDLSVLLSGIQGANLNEPTGAFGSLTQATASLGQTAEQAVDSLSKFTSWLGEVGTRINEITGGAAGQFGAVAGGVVGAGLDVWQARELWKLRRLRTAEVAGGALAGAARGGSAMGRFGRIMALAGRRFAARSIIAGGASAAVAATGVGATVAPFALGAAGIGLAGYGLYEAGKDLLGSDSAEVDPASGGGRLVDTVASVRTAIDSGVAAKLDVTNSLLEQILFAVKDAPSTRPSTGADTIPPSPKGLKTATK